MNRGGPVACIDLSLGRLACLEVAGGKVGESFVQPLVGGAVRQGDPVDPERLGDHLRQLMSARGMKARRARIAISDEAVVSLPVELPAMPARHLRRAIRYAAERHLPFPAGRAAWSWDVLGRSATGWNVLLAGAWRDVVERLVEVTRHARLRCEVVEPRSLAVARALCLERALLLDAGLGRAELTVVAAARAPYVDRAALGHDTSAWPDAVDGLVRRAVRHEAAAGAAAAPTTVVLAGDLEWMVPHLAVNARTVPEVLNGHQPARPAGLPAGTLLANLGLAMRSR